MNRIATVAVVCAFAANLAMGAKYAQAAPDEPAKDSRPNILWISCEDISPNLGCYGDPYASTPNLDKLASQGARFTRCFAPAGVCAIARSAIISGCYPPSIGSQHMRSRIVPPPYVRCFTEYLREAGYYCTNRSKTDYNFEPPLTAWDENSARSTDWQGRKEGQPFFSVINLGISHESNIRKPYDALVHDPAQATLPPFIPDTPVTRKDWARYNDIISIMDGEVGEILQKLEEDGLADSTLVIFWSDHGRGLPRGKRWIYDSGIHVPMIVRWPGEIEPGTVREDLVSFLDFPSTMVSVAGATVPDYMQGQVFLGKNTDPPRQYIFAHRDRMDEAYDLIRAVRDKRFKYIRNFMPNRTYAQHIDYMDQMPTMKEMRRMNAEGTLRGPETQYFQETKPIEELYDTESDPHEIHNLAGDPEYADKLQQLRKVLEDWQVEIGDLGMVPEPILIERMRPGGVYEVTETPAIEFVGIKGDNAGLAHIRSATEGSSIAYTTQPGRDAAWLLYSNPFEVEPGTTVRAVACRLGFQDSQEVGSRYELPR